MKLTSGLFPSIQTKRVHVSSDSNKVDVTLLLYNQGGEVSFDSFSRSAFVDKLFLYMVVLDTRTEKYLPKLLKPHTRIDVLNKWDSMNRKDKSSVIYTKIPMREVLQNHSSIEFNQSDIEGRNNFEIMYETSISNNRLSKMHQDPGIDNVHLLCFINNEIDDSPKMIKISFGTPPSYDLVLSKRDGVLTTPTYRNVFYVNNPGKQDHLQPYYGPAHYHGEEVNPSPTGYVGWMAGHSEGPMGQRLDVREVLNYKITSDLPLAATTTKAGPSENMAFSLDGFSSERDHELVREMHSFFDASNDIRNAKSSFDTLIRSESVNNMNILDYGTNNTSHINMIYSPSSGDDVLIDSHYGFITSVNFKRVIKYFSRFGFLASLYEKYENREVMNKIMYYSSILNLKISRKRLENSPSQHNKQSSLKYVDYDKNEPGFDIVSSSDKSINNSMAYLVTNEMLKDRLHNSKTHRGQIFESNIYTLQRTTRGTFIATPASEYSRQFIVRDYDLFNNVDTGKYTYDLDLEVCDGLSMLLDKELEQYRIFLGRFEGFLNRASVPHSVTSLDGQSGNYNYQKKQFTQSFLSDPNSQRTVEQAVNFLYNAQSLLTGKPTGVLIEENPLNLSSAFNLSFIKLDRLRELLVMLQNSYKSLKHLVHSGEVDIPAYEVTDTEFSIPSMSSRVPANIISVSTRTGIVTESFRPTTLLADYSREEENYQPTIAFSDYKKKISFVKKPEYLSQVNTPSTVLSPYRFCLISKTRINTDSRKLSKPLSSSTRSSRGKGKKKREQAPIKVHGSVKIVAESSQFEIAKHQERSQIQTKINLLQDPSLANLGLSEKTEYSFYPSALKKFYKGVSLGLTRGGPEIFSKLNSFKDNRVFNLIIPDTTPGFREAICRAAYRGDKKVFFLEEVEKSYKDIVLTKEKISSLYDTLLKMFSNYRVLSDQIINNKSYRDTLLSSGKSEKVFENTRDSHTIGQGPFEDHSRELKIIAPGNDPEPISIDQIEIENNMDISGGVVFVKFEPLSSRKQAVAVNNSAFLEIK